MKHTHIAQAGADRRRRWLWASAQTAIAGAVLALTVSVLNAQGQAIEPGSGVALSNPIRVIDGDTIEAAGVRYRLSNIDAPELSAPRCRAERALATRAATALVGLIAAADFVSVTTEGRDRYGRTLGRLWLNGDDAGETLIEDGLAAPWSSRRTDWCGAELHE